MTIQAQLPDGTTLQFPEGTPDAVVNGAVKQHINQQPSDASQTPESKLGLTPAPSEEKPATTDLSGGYVSPEGAYVPPQAIPDTTPSATAAPVVAPNVDAARPHPLSESPIGRVGAAVGEGFSAPPILTPEAEARAKTDNNQTWMGRNIVQPAVTLSELPFRVANAVGSGVGQGAYELGNMIDPRLGRDLYQLNQLAPAFGMETPPRPATFSDARAGANRGTLQVGPSQPPPVTLNDLTGAIERADQPQPTLPPRNTLAPDSGTVPDLPPVPDGYVRLYHGGSDPTSGGARWVTPDYVYARDYRPGQPVSYVDVPRDHPAVQAAIASHPDEPMRLANFNAPEDIAARLQPVAQSSGGAQSPSPGPTSTVPLTAAPAPAIMTQAEMQAHARGFFSPADQAAATNAMLPDANATAVRKLFSDTVPSDPERARITASQPAIQAANNVDATGPMSYATAMDIDRDLTSRMRGASGSDAHDLSQLQQSLRTQMDRVPDLDNLRPGRLAWMQSIKQGQMEDINYGASLKNDPAAADAYVRQRAAALLKNDNAMRNWTPEETAALEQVAKSGDIGTLGRLSVSLIKPITRVAFGTAGHFVAGPLGAIVGGEVGGDIGATQAGRLRSYLSQTTLDPVMQQITRGVPPPNRLAPGGPRNPPMQPSFDPSVLSATLAQLARSRARQASWQAESPP